MPSALADVSIDGLRLNGRLFRSAVSPYEYEAVLCAVARVVEAGPPAPFGHRINHIHLFDRLGMYLVEHHASRLVVAVEFVLRLDEAAFRPGCAWAGELWVGGVRCSAEVTPGALTGSGVPFDGPTLRLWSARRDGVWVGFRATKRRPDGGRGNRLWVADLSVCFDAERGSRLDPAD